MNKLIILFGLFLISFNQNLCAKDEVSQSGNNRTGQTIYSFETEPPTKHNRKSQTTGSVEINHIEIIKETSDQVEFSVTYTYNFDVPVEQVRIFLGAGMDYFRGSYKQVQEGTHTVNLSVMLDSDRLKEKTGLSENVSNYIWVSFDQYEPKKYRGWFYKSEFFFPKVWKRKT